jgi:hypothetical protein
MSTRSRQRISRSPSGADHSLDKTSTSSGSSQKGKEKELPPPPITDPEPEEKVEQEILEEEGELELDISDTITVNGHEVSSIGSEKLDVEDAAKPDPVIRLVMGQKRKPEVVQEDEKVDVEKMEMDDEAKGDESKRAPRKKRKWLKKGEGK